MGQPREHERGRLPRRKALQVRWGPGVSCLLVGASTGAAIPAASQTVPPPAAIDNAFAVLSRNPASDEPATGHGSISVGYQNTYINGMFLPMPGGEAPIGAVRVQSISLDLDYFFADRWSAHLGIPFIEGRYRGDSPHCITQAPAQCRGAVVPSQPQRSTPGQSTLPLLSGPIAAAMWKALIWSLPEERRA